MRIRLRPPNIVQTLLALLVLLVMGALGCGDETRESATPPDDLATTLTTCQSHTFAGAQYSFCLGPATWSIAQKSCRASGMKLAKSDSSAENDFFKSKLSSTVWLGGSSTDGDKWTWDLDGSTFWQGRDGGAPVNGAFTDWFKLEVSLKGVCLSLDALTLKWGAEACSKTHGFVCEGESGPTGPVGPCPNNPTKTSAGVCGCSRQDTDADGDGAPDCVDECPSDPAKKTAGQNGCGAPDTDSDADGVTDREDECATTAGVYVDGTCGCAHYAAPAGTPCNDGITPGLFTCDGKGVCGNPQASAPTPAAGNNEGCRHRERDGKVYWFCNSAKTWDQADTLCRAVPGRRLLSIDDGGENAFVAANVTTESWLGANDRATAGQWRWANVGSGAGELFWSGGNNGAPNGHFTSWADGQPSAAAGACARALPTTGSWDTQSCAQATPGFVCEGAANPNSVPFNGPGNTALPTDGSANTVADPAGGGSASGHIKGPCELLNLSCPPNRGPSANCTPPEVAFAGFSVDGGGSTTEQQTAFANAGRECAACTGDCAACSGAFQPPPADSASCADPVAPGDKASSCEIDVSSGVACTKNSECAANEVCGFVKTCSRCTAQASRWGAGENCRQDGEVCSMTQVCGTPVPGCPYGTETSSRCEGEVEICGTTFGTYEGNPADPFEGTLNGEEISPDEIVKHVIPALPLTYPAPENPCIGGGCVPVPKGVRMPNHPWCQYKLPDEAKLLPELLDRLKLGKSGNGTFVEFNLDPQLKLNYQAMRPPAPGVEPPPGPFGYLDFGVDARASFGASAEFRLKGFGGKVKLVELVASAAANKCGVSTGDTKMALFGKDFLPTFAPDFKFNLPAPEVQAKCQDLFAELLDGINRAKKAYRDAQELMRQLKDWRNSGKKFAISLCEQVLADPPADFPPIPPEACKGELPEDTVNRFIEYYDIQIEAMFATVRELGPRLSTAGTQFYSRTSTGGTGGASDAKDVSIGGTGGKNLRVPIFTQNGFTFSQPLVNIDNEGLDQALFNQTFLVGPIPVNIEISATLNYGINVSVLADVLPWGVLRDVILSKDAQQSETKLAQVRVQGSPWVGAGLAFFVGVGFDVGFAAAKAGIEGALNLGQLSLPVAAGASLSMEMEPDTRPKPDDLAPYVSDLAKVVPKRIGLGLKYLYSADVHVRNVLQGVIVAKVKLKLAFFSKKWKFTLLNFKGICAGDVDVPNPNSKCDITLFSGEGSLAKAFSTNVPWAKLSMPLPFLELKRYYGKAMDVLPDGTLPAIPNPPALPMVPDLNLPSLPGGGISIGKSAEGGVGVKLSSLDETAVFDALQMGAPFFDRLCTCIPDEATPEGQKNERSCASDADCCEGLTCSPAANGKKVCAKSTVPNVPIVPTVPTNITVRAVAPGEQASASVDGAACPEATCSGVTPASAVTVSVTVPFSNARGEQVAVLVAWRGCAAGPTTAKLGAGNTLVYTSTLSNVSADTTCTAELASGALAVAAVVNTDGKTNDGTSTVSLTGTNYCTDVVEGGSSAQLCFALPGAVPTWSATPSNGYRFTGWSCQIAQGTAVQTGVVTSPFDGIPLEAGNRRTCAASFAPALVP